jgi:hypothetical protein
MARNLNPVAILREAATQTQLYSASWNALVHAAQHVTETMSNEAKKRRNTARKARHQAHVDCGLTRVVVNGKTFYE